MANLSLKHIYKVYDGKSKNGSKVKAVNDFCMDIDDKEFIVFVGPSGCGKSTTLRMIAGLEEITAGELYIDGELVNDFEPKDRNIAMVFQNYALYPHMTVYENMAFSLKIAKVKKEEIDVKVREAANILGITEYLDRKPKALSGGQRQRVALGRAIVRNPKVFLLDEPLSNLDAKLRAAMRAEITRLHNRLQTTFIYVTHDQVEAMTMGTRIVVMRDGFVQQIDTPQDLYKYPGNVFVAGFIGTPQMNFFDGTITKDGSQVTFNLECGTDIVMDYTLANKILVKYMNGQHPVVVGVRPDDIKIYNESMEESEWQKASAIVDVVEALGGETILYCNFNVDDVADSKGSFTVKVTGECSVHSGDVIDIAINKRNIHVFDKETELSIKMRVPKENVFNASVANGVMSFAGQKYELPVAIRSLAVDGDYELNVPNNAIILGEGNCKAKVEEIEEIHGKYLVRLSSSDDTYFVLIDNADGLKVGQSIGYTLDAKKIALTGAAEISPLATLNDMDGSFVKLREKGDNGRSQYNFYIKIAERLIPASDEVSAKLFAGKGNKIFKSPLSYIADASDIAVAKSDEDVLGSIMGEVKDILDYGCEKFAMVSVGDIVVNVLLKEDIQVGDKVALTIDQNALSVKDKELDIVLK